MNYLINEERLFETLKKQIEFISRKKEGLKTKEEIIERVIINFGTHEIRHDLHEEELIKPITPETLSGHEELQKEYKELSKRLRKEKMSSKEIPEECDVMMVARTVEKLWEKDVRDMDLISKIIRHGDGSKIGTISNLLKNEKITTPQLLEKIEEMLPK